MQPVDTQTLSNPVPNPSIPKPAGEKDNRFILFIATLLIVLAVLVIGGFYWWSNRTNSSEGIINIKNLNLTEYGEYYSFKTRVGDTSDNSPIVELKIVPPNKNLPKIILDERTLYYFNTPNGQSTKTIRRSLKTGQEVVVMLTYDKKTHKWTTRNVSIIVDKILLKEATSSGIVKL